MKKITYLFSIVLMGALVASCNLNNFPTFNDDDAFTAFTKSSMTIAENGGTLNIPVHVTSLGGVSTTVTYEFVNGTASQGVDFEDASGTGSINFAAGETEKYISVRIIDHPGVFTGDLSFSVRFKSTGDVKSGIVNSCDVTITDIDHPLSNILGTYTANAYTQWYEETYKWTVTISKDNSDLSKVWISDIDPYFGSYGYSTRVYGIVNDDKTEILIPGRQVLVSSYSTALVGFNAVDPYDATSDADIIVTIGEDGTLTIPNGWGIFGTGDGYDTVLDIDMEYYDILDGGATLKKN